MDWLEQTKAWLNPPKDPVLTEIFAYQTQVLPTLWLVGKTGAGKSSLIQAITGDSRAVIGNGFQPCTRTSHVYDFPQDKPLLRFLDTRGLAEAGYDASEDIAECEHRSHALVVVMKADDPEQSAVLRVLQQVKASGKIHHAIVVHTAMLTLPDEHERQQALAYNQQQVEHVLGQTLPQVVVDFVGEAGQPVGIMALQQALADMLPIVAQLHQMVDNRDQESLAFAQVHQEVLWYAGGAAAVDVIPIAGWVAVPALQGKMLHSLANQYGLVWNKRMISELITALGVGFSIRYASRFAVMQLLELVPVYGQTVGAATAATLSFLTTYALGRVAGKYFYHRCRGESVNSEELQALYRQVFADMWDLRQHEQQQTKLDH